MGDNVSEGSKVITDAYIAYNGLDSRFTHVSVKHEDGGYVVIIGDQAYYTQNIENFWSIFKRGIIGMYHFVSLKHLLRYCNEFGYRHNYRKDTGVEKFDTTLLNCSSTRITYNQLIANN